MIVFESLNISTMDEIPKKHFMNQMKAIIKQEIEKATK